MNVDMAPIFVRVEASQKDEPVQSYVIQQTPGRLLKNSTYLPAIRQDCPISALRNTQRITDSPAISRLDLGQDSRASLAA